jgi:hypothetical protein
MKRLFCLFLVALLNTGCLKTYVKRSAALGPDAQLPTLMIHTGVSTDKTLDEQDVTTASDVIAIAAGALQNSMLPTFGETILDSSTPFLEAQGIAVVFDPDRAKGLTRVDLGEIGNKVTFLTGGWTDPRGGVMPLEPRMLFRGVVYAQMGETFHVKGSGKEGYLYVVGTIYERGILFPYPKLALTFVVHNHKGKELLIAQAVGKGSRNIIVPNRSPENLGLALDRALNGLAGAQVKSLD